MRYKDGTNRMMLNLIDSHDTPRFFEELGKNKALQLLTIAALMFYPGSPMIYYGDEIFMDGKQDPFNRKCMRWDSPEYNSPEHKVLCDLLQMRKDEVLIKGDTRIYEKDGLAHIVRSYNDKTLALALNHSGKTVTLDGKMVYSYNCHGNEMPEGSFAVYQM